MLCNKLLYKTSFFGYPLSGHYIFVIFYCGLTPTLDFFTHPENQSLMIEIPDMVMITSACLDAKTTGLSLNILLKKPVISYSC